MPADDPTTSGDLVTEQTNTPSITAPTSIDRDVLLQAVGLLGLDPDDVQRIELTPEFAIAHIAWRDDQGHRHMLDKADLDRGFACYVVPIKIVGAEEAPVEGVGDPDAPQPEPREQWTLEHLRDALGALPEDMRVVLDTTGAAPYGLCSYRGFYERLSIETTRPDRELTTEVREFGGADVYDSGLRGVVIGDPCSAGEFFRALNLVEGERFEGWKGGSYTMYSSTLVHLGDYGDVGPEVVGVRVDEVGGFAIIETQAETW